MNYKILKEIIVTLKEKITCPGCNKHISNRETSIEDISDNQLIVKFSCTRCKCESLIEVNLIKTSDIAKAQNEARKHQGLQVTARTIKTISHDDILDAKNFLKNFTGDFKEIFKN